MREYFYDRDFVEVQTPILSHDVVIDRHLDPLLVPIEEKEPRHLGIHHRFLQTSPEQNMKRLLAGGLKAIFQIGPVFRAGEYGANHNPEFTMAEWYRVGDDLELGISFLEGLVAHLLHCSPPKRARFDEVFRKVVGICPLDASLEAMRQPALDWQLVDRIDWSDDREDWIDLLFSLKVQPTLGLEVPLVVSHFPATQAALAKISDDDPRTAERFEIFYRGIELANGYHELLDAQILRRRNEEANRQRKRDGKGALPEKSWLLDAMEAGLPPCCGCALGFDRVVMLADKANSLSEVLCFPWDRC